MSDLSHIPDKAVTAVARLVPAEELLDTLRALGIAELARPPRTRKSARSDSTPKG